MESFFTEIAYFFVLLLGLSLLTYFLRLPFIVAYLGTGVIIGFLGFDWHLVYPVILTLKEIGIALMLFVVGLSITPKVFREVGKNSLIIGLIQVFVTSVIAFFVLSSLGFHGLSAKIFAVAISFSSTIVIVKMISERKDSSALYAKIAVGILLVQDVVAAVLLVFLSTYASGSSALNFFSLSLPLILLLLLFLGCLVKCGLPLLNRHFSRSQEMLSIFTIAWLFGISALFYLTGFTFEIGALVAGLLIANVDFHFEIEAKARVLRDFFMVFFFLSLGYLLSQVEWHHNWYAILILLAFVVVVKPILVCLITALLGYQKRTFFRVALTENQISEFSLVILTLIGSQINADTELLGIATALMLFSIVLSAWAFQLQNPLFYVVKPLLAIIERRRTVKEHNGREFYDAILFGCHRIGHDFLRTMRHKKISFLVVDSNPDITKQLETKGLRVRYGDAEDDEFISALPLKKASLVISTLPGFEANVFVLYKALQARKHMVVIVTAQTIPDALELYEQGAAYVILPHYLGGNFASMLLDRHGHNLQKFALEKKRHLVHLLARE
ncbi:MAG: cation:proton antiporter [bacterium]